MKTNISDTFISDHKIISTSINIGNINNGNTDNANNVESCTNLEKFAFWSPKCNWDAVVNKLSEADWTSINSDSDIKTDLKLLYTICYEACVDNIPIKKKPSKDYIPHDRKVLMRKRRLQNKKLTSVTSKRKRTEIYKKICAFEKQLIESHTSERLRNENEAVSKIKTNSKVFFSYAKQSQGKKEEIGPLLKPNGKLTNDSREKAEILKEQYEKVFNTQKADIELKIDYDDDETKIHIDNFFEDNAPFSDITISKDDVIKAIEETKINSAPGIDYVPPILLHKCKNQLAAPLTIIMNKSIKTGEIPEVWKEAIIVPIFKSGNKEMPANYRPVSLTSQLAKLLERIIRWYLVKYLEINNAFPDSQHGFREFLSTVSQLLEHHEDIIYAFEKNANIDVVMLDYSKAFDTINISILLLKLKLLGIGGNIGRWIANFLMNRKQKVVVNGYSSGWSKVESGVPQGTILAAVFFLIYIADIGDNVKHSTIASYADDSKARKIIENKSDGEKLQADINSVFTWTDNNLMKFNLSKFEMLRIGKKEDLKNEIKYYTPDGTPIPESDMVKDLGVIFNKAGNFDDHIKVKVAKCIKMCGYILRTFMLREPEPMMCLFKSLVIPIIDYCCIVWNPYKRKDIQFIEKIQRNYTKRLGNLYELNYYQRLKTLNIYSMERRRERYEILYIFKILKHLVPNVGINCKINPRRGRGLVPPAVHKNSTQSAATLRRNSFRSKAAFLFNSLPDRIRNIPLDTPMNSIKHAVDNYLKTVPDEPVLDGYARSSDSASNSLLHQSVRRIELDQ